MSLKPDIFILSCLEGEVKVGTTGILAFNFIALILGILFLEALTSFVNSPRTLILHSHLLYKK